jgi:hypothetical protein
VTVGFPGVQPGEHIGVIQRVVRSQNGVEHFLFVWFGRAHPTARQLARANSELASASSA